MMRNGAGLCGTAVSTRSLRSLLNPRGCDERTSGEVVGRGREAEELLEGGDALVVHLGRELDADVAVVPRLELVARDRVHALGVAQDEAPLVRVRREPLAGRGVGEALVERAHRRNRAD